MIETDYKSLMLLELSKPEWRDRWACWGQSCGRIIFNDKGVTRAFAAGPPKGAADISGITKPYRYPLNMCHRGGLRIEIEMKARNANGRMGKRTKEQKQWADFITSSGGVYLCVDESISLSFACEQVAREISILTAAQ